MKNRPKMGTFCDLIGPGENPYGMTAVTPNGVSRNGGGADGREYVWGESVSGPRWNNEMPRDLVPQFIGATLPRKARGVKK